jgi:hypothetical protein
MTISSLLRNFNGDPNIVTMVTDSSAATITTAGFWALPATIADVEALQNGDFQMQDSDLWLIYYATGVGFYTFNSSTNAFVALTGNAGLSTTLSNTNIFVGNASNVATGVAMSGDATMANTGAITIANNAITTAKINAAAVTLAKLATGIAPAYIVKFAGTQANGGGSATVAITVAGTASTDLPFAQISSSTNAVTVQKVTATTNTVTVLLSGDPGAATNINYQVLRAAA